MDRIRNGWVVEGIEAPHQLAVDLHGLLLRLAACGHRSMHAHTWTVPHGETPCPVCIEHNGNIAALALVPAGLAYFGAGREVPAKAIANGTWCFCTPPQLLLSPLKRRHPHPPLPTTLLTTLGTYSVLLVCTERCHIPTTPSYIQVHGPD